jgi:proteasome lid subunit RPN8/RPN11
MLQIPAPELEQIRAFGEQSFPYECCGALLGRCEENPNAETADYTTATLRQVVEILPIVNEAEIERKIDRFVIEPEVYLATDKAARAKKLDIIGFYHSHPNDTSRPSEFDREHALPNWSYIIVAVAEENGAPRAGTLQSWELSQDRAVFAEEQILEIQQSVGFQQQTETTAKKEEEHG